MSETRNPRAGQGAGVGEVQCSGPRDPKQNRPRLQANLAMTERLQVLIWAGWFGGARHG